LKKDVLQQLLVAQFLRSPSLALIRRSVLEIEGVFDEEIIGTSDWDLWLRLGRSAQFQADPTPQVIYRRHAGQQSQYRRLACKRGNVLVLEKTARWLADRRPDLLPLLHRQLARRYNAYAKAQVAAGDDVPAILRSIQAAHAYQPLSPRTYLEFARLACYWALKRTPALSQETSWHVEEKGS
jgi:hypothetical protein